MVHLTDVWCLKNISENDNVTASHQNYIESFHKLSKIWKAFESKLCFKDLDTLFAFCPVETIKLLLCILFGVLNLSILCSYHEQCTQIHSKCSVHGSLANSAHISEEWKQLSYLQKEKLGCHGVDGLSLGGCRPSHCSLRWEIECRKSVWAVRRIS